jgi:hypothetical protein
VLVGLTAEVTERRRREDALTFLAEAGDALAGSLDPVETLNEVAQVTVPRLADWCAVQLAPDLRGSSETVAVAHVDPDKVRWAEELQARYPSEPDAPTGAPEMIRTGRSELYPEIDEALLRAGARDAEHLQITRQLRMSSAMVVPLRRPRPLAGRDHVHLRRVRAPVLGPTSSNSPRSSGGAPGSRSTTRASTSASTAPPRRSSTRCCRRRCPTSRATSSPPAISPAVRATTSAATGTTPSRCPTAAAGSRSGTSAGAGSSPPR